MKGNRPAKDGSFLFVPLRESFFSCCVDFFSYLCILWRYAAKVFIIHLSLYVYD